MKKIMVRCGFSFMISAFISMVVNMLIELIGQLITKDATFNPLSQEFRAVFATESMAVYVNALIYGLIGATFAGFSVIYEMERVGYILQNLLYYICTACVWVPIVMLMWQLWRYPSALISTFAGFVITYFIMTIVGYRIKKQEIADINQLLQRRLDINGT